MKKVFLRAWSRTPRIKAKASSPLGELRAQEVLAPLLKRLLPESLKDQLDLLALGCVHQVGSQGGQLAATALAWAGLPGRGISLNTYCCSGLDAVIYAATEIASGRAKVAVAGGIEILSRQPMFSDSSGLDGDETLLERSGFLPLPLSADILAQSYDLDRLFLDDISYESHQRSQAAQEFVPPLAYLDAEVDDAPRPHQSRQAWNSLEPLVPGGLHTIGNAPALVDGAGLVLLTASDLDLEGSEQGPAVQLTGWNQVRFPSKSLLEGHIAATAGLMEQSSTPDNCDGFHHLEVNEGFAGSVGAFSHEFGKSVEEINPFGGAIALGHPLGATGAMLVASAAVGLQRRGGGAGLVSIPAAFGHGSALSLSCD